MPIFEFLPKIRKYYFRRNHFFDIELNSYLKSKIDIVNASDWNFNKPFLRNEFFEFFRSFYDDVIYRDDSYLWSGEKLKIKAKERIVAMVKFFNLLAVKILQEKYSY